jgi:hypothetical protein
MRCSTSACCVCCACELRACLGARNTPQAFSHFTYEAGGKQSIVVDVQVRYV